MSFIEVLLLSLALCVDSFIVSTSTTLRSHMSFCRGFLMASIFALMQGLLPFLGALLGLSLKSLVESVDHWIAFSLLLFVGIRMIYDAFHVHDNNQLNVSSVGVFFLLGLATSIDAFAVGIGLGLNLKFIQLVYTVLTISLSTFFVSLLGVFLADKVRLSERIASIIAGGVLIGLGTYTLLQHLDLF